MQSTAIAAPKRHHKPRAPRRTPTPHAAVIRAEDLGGFLGMGTTAAWELRKAPDFPRPVLLGERARGYLRDDLIQWLQSRKAA